MDQVQEGIQDAEEMGSVLARGLGGADVMDDEELLAELNEMEQVVFVLCALLWGLAGETNILKLSFVINRTNLLLRFSRSRVCLLASLLDPWTSPLRPKAPFSPQQRHLRQLRKTKTPERSVNLKLR